VVRKPSDHWEKLNTFLTKIDANAPHELRDAIAAVYEALATRPWQELQDFKTFPEATLTVRRMERARRIAAGDIAISIHDDQQETMLDAARLLRALEATAVEGMQFIDSDRDEELEKHWVTSDGRHFVVPRISSLAPVDNKPFLRRALLHFRVIPTAIGTFRVRLHRSSAALSQSAAALERSGPARRYGAALFPALDVKLSPGSGPFVVEKLGGVEPGEIEEHLARGRAEGCTTIVWGELSMPEASVGLIQHRLTDEALEGVPPFRYLVAGSWHRDVGGMRNVASILGPNGDLLFEVFKWAKFDFEGRIEAIVPGSEVHALICEDELVTVAICRDFLEENTNIPYKELNVDIAIVPSMVGTVNAAATMAGHGSTANTMRVRFATRTLVVAQQARPGGAGSGLVMGLPRLPLQAQPVVVNAHWHRCDLEPS